MESSPSYTKLSQVEEIPKYKPYVYQHLSLFKKILVSPIAILIGIPRLLIGVIILVIGYLIGRIAALIAGERVLNKMNGFSKKALSFGLKTSILGVRVAFNVIKVRTKNTKNYFDFLELKEPHVVIANHTSMLDAFILTSVSLFGFIAKAAIERVPIFGWMIRAIGSLYVTRSTRSEGIFKQIQDRFDEVAEGGNPLAIFPEGTTTNGSYLINFKNGAFLPRYPVAMFHIKYNIGPPVDLNAAFVTETMSEFVAKMFVPFWITAEVKFLGIKRAEGNENDDPILFRDNVRTRFSELSGLEMVDSTIENHFEYTDLYQKFKGRENRIKID